ncbi:diguanylate cyclase [Bradyrhizobium sp. STM 3557]|uniref:diguanylate cyclase n=1 Tax=Bradyrhizobium sp. STM 3557 TaxID=578920 RepID=UPI00388E6B95
MFALFLSAALLGTEAWQMWHVRDANLRGAKIVTASLAESLSHQVDMTLKTADSVVSTLVQRVEAEGFGPDSLQRLYGLMTSLAAALPAIHEMGLIDEDGNAIVKSLLPHPVGKNYSERDYFRFLSTHDTREVFIGVPVRSKVDGSINVTVSRRVNAPDGRFAGVVVTSVSMDFFRKLFESVQDRSGASINLVMDNGTLLASSPASFGSSELTALLTLPTDATEYVSPDDGVRRVGSYNHLSRYPMVAVVAQDSAIVLREWRGQLIVDSAIMLCVLVLIAVLGYRVDRANRATQLHALRDGLTELANRRCFNETLEREFKRAARSRLPLSLIMVDIDLFKSFNDRYGHPAGDTCLRTISATVQSVLRRPSDLAARYGGEEIAIILPETDVAGAIQIVTDLMLAVRARAIPHEGSAHGIVTVSAGIASCNPARRDADSAQLVEKADAALYAAKALGRNAFTVHAATDTAASVAKRREAA